MYRNLNAECARAGISKADLAKNVLNIDPSTFWKKTKTRNGFWLEEALKIREFLKSDLSVEELFQFDDCDEIKSEETA